MQKFKTYEHGYVNLETDDWGYVPETELDVELKTVTIDELLSDTSWKDLFHNDFEV